MDRNFINIARAADGVFVALRKESVDRNASVAKYTGRPRVALRKESVDRNL